MKKETYHFKLKEFAIDRTKQYFKPIKSIWFWLILIPLSFIAMVIVIALQGVR